MGILPHTFLLRFVGGNMQPRKNGKVGGFVSAAGSSRHGLDIIKVLSVETKRVCI